jgi:hypothetical protein
MLRDYKSVHTCVICVTEIHAHIERYIYIYMYLSLSLSVCIICARYTAQSLLLG